MMRLIVDTNILISSLIKDSITREILLLPFMDFYLPEFALEEVEAHKTKISKLSGLSRDEIDFFLDLLLENISIVPARTIRPYLKEAEKIIGDIDPGDIPFIALALAVDNDGIWSNDKHFRKVKKLKVWKTPELLAYIKKM
jgi:predicted nucleic acid-binding protein